MTVNTKTTSSFVVMEAEHQSLQTRQFKCLYSNTEDTILSMDTKL